MRKSPAQVYAATFGATLVLAGILGFFYNADFSTGDATTNPANRDALIGLFDINGWHNLVHIASGAIGLAVASSWVGARRYALGFGIVYLIVAAAGFAIGDGESLLGLVPINTADNLLHTAIAVLGVLAGVVSPTAPRPTMAGDPSPAFEPSIPARAT
jgi:hypothetical protein